MTVNKRALIIVDMQQGLFSTPRHDTDGLVARINRLTARLRAGRSPIIFIQHCGPDGDVLHPSQPGHALLGDLSVDPGDTIITKESCDAFLDTGLASALSAFGAEEVVVTGCATDFCVDTTIRSALARGYPTTVPEDGHTTFDRPYLSARKIIEHHNAVWANFISPVGAAHVVRCDAIA